ncbi:MarR family winged helix-turn-helix transcriptional regulator [Komagataeibacter xylinus]|uniref:MarR family winged helix-turn-helix transcriptional regulator n=1 Tax=Komagataeibacter xylinus TaxID=28448 RepID=UPI00280ADEA4|nr:MarR family winged helix-turn-helix transcriptional regulator [Komagataeibacter xylinus]
MTQPSSQTSYAVSRCNCTALRKASRRLSLMYDATLAPCGLKSTQFSILSEIERRHDKPPTMSELADAMVMDRSTLGHNLRPLERDGLIALKAADADRRWKHVHLTKKGLEKYSHAHSLWREAQHHFEGSFGRDKADHLRETLLGIAADPALASIPSQPIVSQR